MIDYSKTKIGDKLKIVGQGAPGYAELGDIVTVEAIQHNRVDVVTQDGNRAYFALTCGAMRLENQTIELRASEEHNELTQI